MIKLQKRPDDIILATDFKKIGRNTSVQQSLIQLMGYTTMQMYDSGLIKKLEAIFDDRKVSPSEKNELAQTLSSLITDYNIAIKDAEARKISTEDIEEKFEEVVEYINKVIADMNSIYIIPDSEVIGGVWILNILLGEYNELMEDMQESITYDTATKEYYGSIRSYITTDKTSIGINESATLSLHVTYKNNNVATAALSNIKWYLNGTQILGSTTQITITYSQLPDSGASISCTYDINTELLN